MKAPKILPGLIATLTTVSLYAVDDFTWNTAGPADWNNPANWTATNLGSGGNFRMVNNGGIAQITANPTLPTSTLYVGLGAGTSGVVNHLAGTRSTTGDDGTLVGHDGGTGTYNLANTSLVGGIYSGFARGSGSMTSTGFPRLQYRVGCEGGTGTLNINTTGSIVLTHLLVGDRGVGTVNFDGGNFSTSTAISLGSSPGGNGTWRMSGGSATLRDFWIGTQDGTGSFTLNAGTVTATGLGVGFGGNFADSATGSMTMTGGLINTGYLGVGYSGAKGSVLQSGGIVNVNAGWFSIGDNHVNSSGSTYALTGGELNVKNNSGVEIGKDAVGAMSVSGTGRFSSTAFEAVLGRSPSGAGTLEISENGNVTGLNMTIGKAGAGILNLSGNGVLDMGFIWLADTAGASGTINGNGGTLITNGLSRIAGSALLNANGIKLTIRESQSEFLLGFTSANIEL